MFAIVESMLGAGHVKVRCEDGKERLARIPGKLRKRVWIREGDVVLVSIWDFQPHARGDIAYRYTRDEVRKLEEKGLLQLYE